MPYLVLPCLIAVLLATPLHAQNASFVIQSSGSNPAIDSAAAYAADLWSPFLVSNIPIKVNFNYVSLGTGGTLGITLPNGRKDFFGAPVADTWYPSCLANAIANAELNQGETDMDIVINSDANWYFGTDGNPGFSQYDFVSVLMHEIGHGLGIMSLAKVDNGVGSFGEITELDFLGIASFPFPMLDGRPAIYDLYLSNDSQQYLTDTSIFLNNSTELLSELTGNQVFYTGENGLLANAPDPVKLYAPSSFALGSSILHLDENTFPSSDSNSLMTPFSGQGEVEHHPGPIVLGIMQDIGWPESVFPVGIDERIRSPFEVKVYQCVDRLITTFTLADAANVSIQLTDLNGRPISYTRSDRAPGRHQVVWDVHDLKISTGVYLLALSTEKTRHTIKIILR